LSGVASSDRVAGRDVGRTLTILHVSDLHFGKSHRFESEVTAAGDRIETGQTLLGSLKSSLTRLLLDEGADRESPVLIAITGDLTDTAAEEEFTSAAAFVRGLEEFLSGRSGRAVIVPGNHDVTYTKSDLDARLYAWRAFATLKLKRELVGREGQSYAEVYDLSESHGAVVAAINSAAFVQQGGLDQDRGRISVQGIRDLEEQLQLLAADDRSLRIALVHHHPVLIPDLVEAGRGYDAIVDGGDLMKVLRRHKFHLILHGHKHLPFQFSEDSRAAFSTRQPREQRPILVVCGGSAGSSAVSEKMETPTNFFNILRVKWLPQSGECRSRVEPHQLVRFESGTELPRSQWRWEPCLPDDRCYEPSHSEREVALSSTTVTPFADSDVPAETREDAYRENRWRHPVAEIRPSLVPSQAHEAYLWIEHHNKEGFEEPPGQRLIRVVWSAGPRHEVRTVDEDESGSFETLFSYYGPMLVMAELTFADNHQSTQFIYVPMRRRQQDGGL
jgi:3',5'-cyclic AMP phosphodiesterase CpdA